MQPNLARPGAQFMGHNTKFPGVENIYPIHSQTRSNLTAVYYSSGDEPYPMLSCRSGELLHNRGPAVCSHSPVLLRLVMAASPSI